MSLNGLYLSYPFTVNFLLKLFRRKITKITFFHFFEFLSFLKFRNLTKIKALKTHVLRSDFDVNKVKTSNALKTEELTTLKFHEISDL